MKKETLVFSLTLIAIYVMIVIVALKTPMHSDDFSYSFLGLSPADHVRHYMSWSGRLVADYISTIILSLKNHYLIASINSLGSLLLIYNIAKLPDVTGIKKSKLKTSCIALFVFFLYWCGNPNLGQVMFWVVGSANYVWTTLIVIFFLRKTIEFRESNIPPSRYLCFGVVILGFIAGCSNENTGVTLIIFLSILALYYRLTRGSVGNIIFAGFFGALIGGATLILAPGNYVRANLPLLEDWRSASIATKSLKFLFKTIPDVMAHDWLAMLSIIIISVGIFISGSVSKKTIALILGVLICFLLSNAVMIASPWYPPRAMNTQFIFLVCLSAILLHSINDKYFFKIAVPTTASLLIYFAPIYASTYVAYKHAYEQSKIRAGIIEEAKINNITNVNIPLFYFRWLINDGFKFDTWHSNAIAKYYGVNTVSASPVYFDYSIINAKCDYKPKLIVNNNSAKCIFTYYDIFSSETYFVVEFDKGITKTELSDVRLFIKPTLNNGTTITRNTGFAFQTTSIGKRNFTFLKVQNIKPSDVKNINFGYYSSAQGTIFANEKLTKNNK